MKTLSREMLKKEPQSVVQNRPFVAKEHMKIVQQGLGMTVVEFIGTTNFSTEWYARQQYEVDNGRDQEPLLYGPIYQETRDPNFPKNITVYKAGPGAVIFEEVTEGGEAKFVTVESGSYPVEMKHYAAALEYSKDLIEYNMMWDVPLMEQQAGIAFNALKNHVHLAPFIQFAYGAANQTAASAVGANFNEKLANTFDDAIQNSKNDGTNPRRGPYVLLISEGDLLKWSRIFIDVPQQGYTVRPLLADRVSTMIAYDGWTGRRGKKTVTYPGVTQGKAYLIDVGDKMNRLRSFVKQDLMTTTGNPDVTRFILEQVVWDAYFTAYADVLATTEEISLPTS